MVDRISAPVEGWTGRRLRVNREACCTVVVIRWSARGIARTWRVELCMGRAERQIINLVRPGGRMNQTVTVHSQDHSNPISCAASRVNGATALAGNALAGFSYSYYIFLASNLRVSIHL
jgi:hypothetical protein